MPNIKFELDKRDKVENPEISIKDIIRMAWLREKPVHELEKMVEQYAKQERAKAYKEGIRYGFEIVSDYLKKRTKHL